MDDSAPIQTITPTGDRMPPDAGGTEVDAALPTLNQADAAALAAFVAEILAGVAAGSASLQADALDFFGDAANYAISPGVAGMALTWRARGCSQGRHLDRLCSPGTRSHRLACFPWHDAASRSDGLDRHRGTHRQWRRRTHALPVSLG
jgi:hypothetical protein